MPLIKKLRKPFVALCFATLTLFASCSQYDNEIEQTVIETSNVVKSMKESIKSNAFSLWDFADKHIEISKEIATILKKDKNLNLEVLDEAINTSKVESYEEFDTVLKLNNIKESSTIIRLMKEMEANNDKFLKSNPDIVRLNQNELGELIGNEIYSKVDGSSQNNPNGGSTLGPCEDEYDSDMNSCHFNLALSAGASVALAIISGGIGGVYSGTMAMVIWTGCIGEAWDDMENCLGN